MSPERVCHGAGGLEKERIQVVRVDLEELLGARVGGTASNAVHLDLLEYVRVQHFCLRSFRLKMGF